MRLVGDELTVVRVLCSGDIHIGRRLSRVSESYRSADAWSAIVELAIREQVDVLALSGDVVDQESKSYEALGPLQAGLATLDKAGIETVAVAGNHDHDVLVRLADIVGTERFHLLGRGGKWERHTIQRGGVSVLHIDGWSFPSEHVKMSPGHEYAPDIGGAPVMTIVHGDVGNALSRYAPLQLTDFWAHDIGFLLMGHIHAPRVFDGPGGRKALYPGSPWALDPGEPGVHGAWIAEFRQGEPVDLQPVALSPVRYTTRVIDLTGIEDEHDFQRELNNALIEVGQAALDEHPGGYLKTVSVRLRGEGQSPVHRQVPDWVARAAAEVGSYSVDSIVVEIDTFVSDVHPVVDLEQLAQGTDPVSGAARLLLALDEQELSPAYDRLLQDVLQSMVDVHAHPGYASLKSEGDPAPTEQDAREVLASRAWEMLSMLVAQESVA